jgi:hypothetical protein
VFRRQAMAEGRRLTYEVADHEVLAETPELRMVMLTLAEGQEGPWHWHTNVTDRFFCMQGPMVVETRAPPRSLRAQRWQYLHCASRRAPSVMSKNGCPCRIVAGRAGGLNY